MPNYSEATSEVTVIAERLINLYHKQLADCRIGFVFRDEPSKAGGKIVLAKTSKVPANLAPYLTEEIDMLVMIAESLWVNLNPEQQQACIDHEFCHIVPGENGEWSLRAHDIEEFKPIIERYGFWTPDLFSAAAVLTNPVHQMTMPFTYPTEKEKTQRPRGGLFKVQIKHFDSFSGQEG